MFGVWPDFPGNSVLAVSARLLGRSVSFFGGLNMRPSSRHRVSKGKSARRFRHAAKRSKAANVAMGPMRGGWRF